MKPFSQACENNKQAIFAVLKKHFAQTTQVLEIGSGTGQHAVYFASKLPYLCWQTSDLLENHVGILAWLAEYEGNNVQPPVTLDVAAHNWPLLAADGIFSANTTHIMAWSEVLALMAGAARLLAPAGELAPAGKLVLYGPLNYGGCFISDSNSRFNEWLKSQAPYRAIRDFESVCEAAGQCDLQLLEDCPMPANNRCLIFQKN